MTFSYYTCIIEATFNFDNSRKVLSQVENFTLYLFSDKAVIGFRHREGLSNAA